MSVTTVSSDPGNHFQKAGEITSFPIMNPNFDKPQTDPSLINSQFILPSSSESQSRGYTWKDMHTSAVSQTPDDNEIQKCNVAPPAAPTLQSKGLSPIGIPAVIEIPRLPFSQHFTYNVSAQIKSRSCQPNPRDVSVVVEKEQVKVISESEHAVRNHLIDVKDLKNVFSFQTHLTEASTSPEGGTCEFVKNEIRPPSGLSKCISAHVTQDHIWINRGHDTKAGEALLKLDSTAAPFLRSLGGKQIVEMIGSNASCLTHSRETSGQIGSSLTNTTLQPCDNQSALLDKSKPATRSMNPPAARKLWDGTLQLNTSATVSAVAFFKSGEKASEINWSQYIEVKGKVRLEAFEKFIQELPRSRSRALMVISLRWKVGSSETGLTCMKEITKTYKEGQKVGYAQLSPGTDLYVCPRSDTIITILAKYGFFKGMAAIEEDQDSLIGCVVWRRGLTPSGAKVMESKKLSSEKSSDSPAEESGRQAAEPTSTLAITQASEKSQSISRSEDEISRPSPVQPMAILVPENKMTSTLNSSLAPTLAVNSTNGGSVNSVLATTEMQVDNDAAFSPIRHPAGVPNLYLSASTKPDLGVNLKQPLLTGVELSQGPQHNDNCSDDDLPEFDFVAACGTPKPSKGEISRSTETSLTVINNKQLKVEQSVSLCATSKTSRKTQASQFPSSLPVIDLSNVPGKVVDHFSDKAEMQRTEALRRSTSKRENGTSAAQGFNIHSHQKKFWDDGDDDDMPEWCPPDMDFGNSPSSPSPMLLHRPFHHPDHDHPDPQSPLLPPGPTAGLQLRQRQQGSERHRVRAMFPPSEPSRLPMPNSHPSSGRGFSQQPPVMSKYSPIVDRRHQTQMRQIPSCYRQSSEDSPPWSPSLGKRCKSSLEHDHMFLLDRKFSEDQCEWINSADVSCKLPRNQQYGRSGEKRDRFYDKYQNETSRRRYHDLDIKYEYREFSPKRKESLRRRPTGFDVLPDSPRPTHRHARDQYPRRHPSQFDDRPRERSSHGRW